MNRTLITLVLLIAVGATVVVLPGASDGSTLPLNVPPKLATKLALITDRQMVFTFSSSGCHYCTKFKEEALDDPEVEKILKHHYVLSVIQIDRGELLHLTGFGTISSYDLAYRTGFEGTPHTVLLYPGFEGLPLPVVGYRKPSYFVDVLRYYGRGMDRRGLELEYLQEGDFSSEVGGKYYNYRRSEKRITREEFEIIRNSPLSITVIEETPQLEPYEGDPEAVLPDPSEEGLLSKAREAMSAGKIRKLYLVQEQNFDE